MVDTIIKLSEKYIFDRNRPDKEIDILDEVCSRVSMNESLDESDFKNIKKEINKINKEKNSYIIDNNIAKAYDLRKRETELTSMLNEMELSSYSRKNEITLGDVANVISSRCDVPVNEIIDYDVNVVNSIYNDLKRKIVGQDVVIDDLINIIKRVKFGYKGNCYSCLFVGSSGVGKSALAKYFAEFLVGESNFIRLDMSEYSDTTSVNKILGSSPGYVGYDDNKNILEEIRNKPNSVLLLDEIDKAHPNVINLFYQILEEGKIKDSKGHVVRFNNIIILMTSNIGFERENIGFNKVKDNAILTALKNRFNTAFINRIDNILIFNRLSLASIKVIIKKKLEDLSAKYSDINITYSDSIIDEIANSVDYYEFGARKIEKIISKNVENIIIDAIINNKKEVYIDSLICQEKTSLF